MATVKDRACGFHVGLAAGLALETLCTFLCPTELDDTTLLDLTIIGTVPVPTHRTA